MNIDLSTYDAENADKDIQMDAFLEMFGKAVLSGRLLLRLDVRNSSGEADIRVEIDDVYIHTFTGYCTRINIG